MYLSMVATWYFQEFEADLRQIEQTEQRKRSTRDMKLALVSDINNPEGDN